FRTKFPNYFTTNHLQETPQPTPQKVEHLANSMAYPPHEGSLAIVRNTAPIVVCRITDKRVTGSQPTTVRARSAVQRASLSKMHRQFDWLTHTDPLADRIARPNPPNRHSECTSTVWCERPDTPCFSREEKPHRKNAPPKSSFAAHKFDHE